jgi:hypothetical protein
MANILKRSNHPVEVKKIHLRLWSLRSEIEAALKKKLDDNPGVPLEEIDISDVRHFYGQLNDSSISSSQEPSATEEVEGEGEVVVKEDEETEAADELLDSSGNAMDDDALAMMAALQGDDEEAEEEEEDDAAALAAAMLEGQVPTESEDLEEEQEEDDAAALAAAMLEGQVPTTNEVEEENLEEESLNEVDSSRPSNLPAFKRLRPQEENTHYGFTLISDINMDQILIFSTHGFSYGQTVVVEFLIPNRFDLMVKVIHIADIGRNSRIISKDKLTHRLQCIFTYSLPGSRGKLRSFLQSVEPEIPPPVQKVKKDEDDDDDDFDDLGF